MKTFERGEFQITIDKLCLDEGLIHNFLCYQSYWAKGRTLETVRTSIEQSLCFGVMKGDEQIGFARVVTDYATFAWLCDVFILDEYRGKGLGKWLVDCVTTYEPLLSLRIWLLATTDAHELYRRYGGFDKLSEPGKWMIRNSVVESR